METRPARLTSVYDSFRC